MDTQQIDKAELRRWFQAVLDYFEHEYSPIAQMWKLNELADWKVLPRAFLDGANPKETVDHLVLLWLSNSRRIRIDAPPEKYVAAS